jgi:hypothetical protein
MPVAASWARRASSATRTAAERSARALRFPAANQFEERDMADEKEVIVTDGGGGGGSGAIIAVVLVLVLLVVLFFVFGRGLINGNNPTDIKADVKVETPSK